MNRHTCPQGLDTEQRRKVICSDKCLVELGKGKKNPMGYGDSTTSMKIGSKKSFNFILQRQGMSIMTYADLGVVATLKYIE